MSNKPLSFGESLLSTMTKIGLKPKHNRDGNINMVDVPMFDNYMVRLSYLERAYQANIAIVDKSKDKYIYIGREDNEKLLHLFNLNKKSLNEFIDALKKL